MTRHSMQPRMYIQKAVTLCGQDQHPLSGQARHSMQPRNDCFGGARLFTNVGYNYSPLCVEKTYVRTGLAFPK